MAPIMRMSFLLSSTIKLETPCSCNHACRHWTNPTIFRAAFIAFTNTNEIPIVPPNSGPKTREIPWYVPPVHIIIRRLGYMWKTSQILVFLNKNKIGNIWYKLVQISIIVMDINRPPSIDWHWRQLDISITLNANDIDIDSWRFKMR